MFKKLEKKKLMTGAATAAVLLSLAAGMLFNGVTEITPELTQTQVNQPPIVMDIDEFGNATLDDDDDDATEQKKAGSVVQRIKQAIMGWPVAVRILIVTPLWLLGTVIMTATSILGRALFASPIGALALSAVVAFGVLTGVYAITAKTLFPDVPMRKILSKQALATLAIVSIGLAVVDELAPLFWAKYPWYAGGVKLGVGALVIGVLSARVKRFSGKVETALGLN